MKAEISFHCKFCRGRVDDSLLQDVQLEILDHPDLACKVEDNQVLIEGCLRTDVDQESNITGEIVCIHWKDARSFLAKSKNMGSCSTVMVQVDTPKNHFITIHCNFSENRVILLDSFQCTHGLDMYPELALELEHLMKDQNISLIPVAIQKEINDGFFHSFMNSLTVEWSKLLTTQQTYEIFLNELKFFQGVLKSTMTREKSLIDHDMKRNGSMKEIVKERIQRGVAKGRTLEDIKNSMKTSLALKLSSCHSESFVISLGSLCVRFYEKVSISFVTKNGVDIIRCKGSFVDLRTIKTKIKAKQDLFEKCSQIEIQADLYFLVNCDVKWRGKNVIIVTDTLIVDGDEEHFSLDISGKNGPSHDKKEARNGTESDSDGFAGEPGMHGESGGNVQIIANVFQNAEYMYVLSGGGKGSDGQDGGSGKDGISGEDGKGISEEDFNKRFPDVAYFRGSTAGNNFRAFKKNNTFTSKSDEFATGCFDTTGMSLKAGEYYFNGVTDDNYAVEYGCYSIHALLSFTSIFAYPNRESYCVCSGQPGSSGTPGGNGGKGGKGGKGGFEGSVDIRNWKGKQVYTIKTSCHPGQCGSDGRDGKGGIGGKNGKNGNDRAHVCPSQASSTRVYAGHLSIVAYETSTCDRSYCPKRKRYIDIKRKASEYPTLQRCKNGKKGQNDKRVNNRMTETSRTKKAPIVFKTIKERFKNIFISKDDNARFHDNFEANTTRMDDFTSYTSFQHIRKVIKDTREHDYKNEIQSKQLASVCIANKSSHFNDTQKATFERNHHLEKFLMQKVETAISAVLTAVKKDSKEAFPERELCTIFAIIDQMSIHNSFDEKHYEYFLDLIYLIKNKCIKPICEENWTNLHINYWEDKIMINFKFYLLEKVETMVRLYTKEKIKEMDPNDPYSKTIMDDLQIGMKTFFKHLILSVFKSDDVSHLKTMEQSVQTQLEDLMQEITDYRRTVSLFEGSTTMCVAKDVEAFSEPVNAESDSGSEMDIEGQLDSDIEIVEESKTDATFSKESDLETSFIASGNCKAFNDVNIEKDNESESESDSDITALLEWAKSNSTNKVDVCCIIEKLHYIQSENISLTLKCLRYRLINQCCQISEEFLLWLLMSLFENGECIENGQCLRMIATTKPENWIFEWLIQEMMIRSDLEDESICRDVLSKVHGDNVYFFLCRYLSKLGEGELMTNHTIDVMVESLETLNPEVDESLLAVLEKTNIFEWSYQIKWNENINSLQSLPFSWQDESKLLDAAYYSSQIINRNGQKFVNEVYHCVKTYPVEQNIFLSALKRLYTGSLSINIEDLYLVESSEEASRIFGDNFIHHGIRTRDCILSIMKADSNTTLTEDQVRTIESILAQINKRSSKPSTVLTNTTEEDEDKNEYTTRNILSFTQNDIKVWSQVCKQKLKSRRLRFSEIFTEIAAVIERAITLKRGYGLRNTQKISIISFLFDLDASHKGILQQMSTGEGKTIVIVVLSILKVLQGEKVDIITSSSVLAKRDSDINKDIFDLFEISVSNNCSEDKHDRQDAYLSFVVYGEIGTFQRDILLTEFYDENIIGGRYRENVIVDEVDSMLLDRGETVLYLSHEIAGIDAIEFVYTYIWSLVNSKEMIGTDDDRKSVRQCMLDAMYGMISMTDISKCFPPENTINVHEIWNKLKKENIIDSEGRLLTRSYARFNQLGNNGTTNDGVTAGHVISMLKDTVRKGILVEIPKFLESFINRHLDTWIRNAFNAKYMEEGKHFIIDIDRTENDRGKDVNIVIMDIDTGTEQYHMQWNSGLHQFLQLKYKCAISSESLKAVFMSNISFFRLYNNLFGLTGTLGSQKERDLLKDMYNVSYITIPTFQEPKFVEHDTYLCDSTDKWVKLITETAVSLSKYRPVLVICETIHSCDEIEKEFKKNRVNAYVYKNSYCELSILKNETELESGCIILATNLAGRGTDIRISEDISVLGGLHVILTYLPSNLRIEEQAFGRAARKGQHGSGQLIICECMEGQHKTNEILTISRMKIQRDTSENERISKIQQRYETFIRAEERLFRKFQTFYDKLKQTLITKQTEPEFQKVILQALLDRWAFWLDSVETSLEISGNFSSIKDSLGEFLQEIDVSWVNHDSSKMTMMLHSPSQLVKAGKAKTSSQEYNNAQTFFDKVIDCDPSFSESALYYKVHCLLKRGDCTSDDFKIVRNIFGVCKYLIEQRIEKLRNAVQIVNVISSQYTKKRETFTVSDGFFQQKENAIQIYYQIIDSIDSMNGYAIEPTMFEDATCGQLNANMIFRDLDTMGILSPHRVRVFPPEKNTWQSVSESYELYSKEIYSKLNQLKDKNRVTADNFQDILPSREELWVFLKDIGVLKDTKDCILLHDRNFQRSRHIVPMRIIDILKSLECKSVDSDIDIKKHIFLYSDQKDKILAGEASLIRIDTFKDYLGFGQIFEVLKREKIVSTCSFALLAPESEEKMLHSRLPKFDHVGCNTFVIMGVPRDTSNVIFDQLVANEILSIDGRLLTLELGSIWRSSFSNYTTEVRNIVAKYSKYRICTFHLLTELELPIDLFSRPHEILFGDLIESGIVTPFKVKGNISEKEKTEQLKFLYGHECDKKKSQLIDSELPKILSSEINDLCRGGSFTAYEIERDLIDKMICVRGVSKDLKYLTVVIKNDSLMKTSLKQELSSVENEIKSFISSRLQNYQITSDLVAQLERLREGLAKFDNVDTELRSLADSCTEEQLIGLCDEILSMTNHGFGDLIIMKERKWTFKSVFKMFCILAIGLIQIGLALAIEFYSVGTGTFVANALLSEGVGDIMFAVECMISGHCTMQSYLHHKALSVAITVASAGIGAFFGRGSKFSRFGYTIVGQNLPNLSGTELLKEGMSTTLLARAAAKRIGNKLVEVGSMKLVDKGVDFVIEKTLRTYLVDFFGEIITPKVALKTIEILTKSLSALVRKVGKQNAEQIVEKFINKCLTLQKSDVSVILSKFSQIANAFGNGLGEAMEKLGHSGDSRMETLSIIAKIVNRIGKGIQIVNAVQEVGSLRSSILEKFNNEIVAKLQFEDGDVEVKDCESWASAQVDNAIKKANTEVTKYLEMELEEILIKPLLQKVGNKITKQITKSISKLYCYGKTCLHQSDFNRLKAGHESELQQAPTETKDEIKLQYYKASKIIKEYEEPKLVC
ncbi:Hypothetical predicted protein [Mytilus galloprovincialis]|uniref:Protein translocase subunit SecA n=1 Tax=Mytilus galloprovincialis TaxID=29158 RepID=A0A8B6G4T8_MYTGA|nr:Hypothetical predicted protein [Mytilus galloprovincialis]